jgi:SOS-response transcriptional repressor LexA
MRQELSPRQLDFTRAVVELTRRRGIPPTLAEIGDELGVTLQRAAALAAECEARGAIARERRVARSLRVLSTPGIKSKRASGGNR